MIFIILIGYVIITNLPPSINYKTPNEINSNPDLYLNKSITVKGYLDKNTEGLPIITDINDATKPRIELTIDYSNISNRDNLIEGRLYYFTGIIKRDFTNPLKLEVYLELITFKPV